jgi:8-oxo-dGTP diphosphatase
MNTEIAEIYGNKVRIRVCGLCWGEADTLLMVKHRMGNQDFWAPPGGGVEFGESLENALKREFLEETTLRIYPGKFLFGCEYISDPLHAVELFFEVKKVEGIARKGRDPEIQLIKKVQFLSTEEIRRIPSGSLHGIFGKYDDFNVLRQLTGFHRI